jgi:hypothetical protein
MTVDPFNPVWMGHHFNFRTLQSWRLTAISVCRKATNWASSQKPHHGVITSTSSTKQISLPRSRVFAADHYICCICSSQSNKANSNYTVLRHCTIPAFAWRNWGKSQETCQESRCPRRNINEMPLPHSRRPSHGSRTITPGVDQMPLTNSRRPSHGGRTIISTVEEMSLRISEDHVMAAEPLHLVCRKCHSDFKRPSHGGRTIIPGVDQMPLPTARRPCHELINIASSWWSREATV